jgi:putative nucleotidyltransferase with HDIG domain
MLTKEKRVFYNRDEMEETVLITDYTKSLLKFLENGRQPAEIIKIKKLTRFSIEELSLAHLSALSTILEKKVIDESPPAVIRESEKFLEAIIKSKEETEDLPLISKLSGICGLLTSTIKSDQLLNLIMKEALNEVKGETGSLMLLDKKKKVLTIKASVGLSDDIIKRTRIRLGEGIAGKVAQSGKPLLFNESRKRREIKSALCVPLCVEEKIIGVLSVNRIEDPIPFTKKDLAILSFLANLAAATITSTNLHQEIKKGYLGTVKALIAAVEAKDHYTRGHSEAVARYATAIAKEFGFNEEEIERIYIAGLLHDIGKIGIKEEILLKPGKLTREEYEAIKEHPMIGAKILEPAGFHKDVMAAVSFHHERPDGFGYPEGLRDIFLGASIINVADAFDAMTSERPYRPALSIEEAVSELKKHAGTQFNKDVVKKFVQILVRKGVIKE